MSGQSLDQLEKERLNIIKEIEKTSQLLDTHKKNKASAIKRLNTLELQFANSERLIQTLKQELDILKKSGSGDFIMESTFVEDDLSALLNATYKQKILNPDNQKENAIRDLYLKQFVSHTSETNLEQGSPALFKKRAAYEKEKENLKILEKRIDSISTTLKNAIVDESALEETYSKNVSKRKKLNDDIRNLLFSNVSNQTTIQSTSATNGFKQNKGFFGWPVDQGKIELRYGEQKYNNSETLVFVNTGIDIASTSKNAKAIYQGEIITVSNISKDNITIIIKHEDDFYTVYSNLSINLRKKGDYVSEGEILGELNKNNKGKYQIHFEVWRSKENLNPYHWLKNN